MNKNAELTSAMLKLEMEADNAFNDYKALPRDDCGCPSGLEGHLQEVIWSAEVALHILRKGTIL